MIKVPVIITYSNAVFRKAVRITLMVAALNHLEVKSADNLNDNVQAPCAEKMWTVLGPEFVSDAGKPGVTVSALNGLKLSGAAFRRHLARCMDPDLWMRHETHSDDRYSINCICCAMWMTLCLQKIGSDQ